MIGILLGSESDWEVMLNCSEKLEEFNIHHDMVVASAHRNPEKVTEYIKKWEKLGYKVFESKNYTRALAIAWNQVNNMKKSKPKKLDVDKIKYDRDKGGMVEVPNLDPHRTY